MQTSLLQEREPLPGPGTGFLSNTRKWIVWGDTSADKERDFCWERAPRWKAGGSGNPGERLCHMACSLGFYSDGVSFRVVFSQSFWLRVLPCGTSLVQPRWMPERRILGGGRTCGVSFWPFLSSSGWWWLISSVFLTRTPFPKTTQLSTNNSNGYYGAWPGWAVSVSVLPLTSLFSNIKGEVQARTIFFSYRGKINHWNEGDWLAYTTRKHTVASSNPRMIYRDEESRH